MRYLVVAIQGDDKLFLTDGGGLGARELAATFETMTEAAARRRRHEKRLAKRLGGWRLFVREA